jgi:scyllo-inositol 2-dehydrogenase (NADP+)
MELRAIVTGDAERQRQASAEHPGATLVATADELHARDDVDLVVISTPNRTHGSLAHAALEAGRAVVVDKPLAPTAREARAIVDDAARRKLFLTVYQNRRWDGDFLTLRRLLAEERLGQVYRFESRLERWRPTPKPGWRERSAPEEAGGLLYDLGSHLIDQALVLFGPVADVYAELDRRRAGVTVDDDTFVALRHVSGVRSHLWTTMLAAQEAPRFRVLGSTGAFTKSGTDPQEAALRAGERPLRSDWGVEPRSQWGALGIGGETVAVPTDRGSYAAFYEAVVRSLREGAPAPVDPANAVATLEIIERCVARSR